MKSITKTIASQCALVRYTCTKFAASKNDPEVAKRAAEGGRANNRRTGGSIIIIPKDSCPDYWKIAKIDGEIRNQLIYPWTTPTMTNGVRLATAKSITEIVPKVEQKIAERQGHVSAFIEEQYPMERERAIFEMGDYYRRDLFPPAEHVAAKFGASLSITGLADATASIIGLPADVMRQIEADTRAEHDMLRDLAVKQVGGNLFEAVDHVIDRMEAYTRETGEDGGERVAKTGQFRNTLLSNLIDAAVQAEAMDLSDDRSVAKIATEVIDALNRDVDDINLLRTFPEARKVAVRVMLPFRDRLIDLGHGKLAEADARPIWADIDDEDAMMI